MSKKPMPYLIMITMVFLLISGCASTSGKAKESEGPQYSGFLSDYSKLEPDLDGSNAMRYRNPNTDFKKYKKIILDPIRVSLHGEAQYKAIDPEELKALTDYFREAIARELGDAYPLVNEPGPDVLRARIAITDLVPTKPEMSVVVLVTPYATVADLASGAATKGGAGSAPYLGYTSLEGEGLDSMTLEQVIAYVEQRYPKKYDVDVNEGVGQAVTKGYSEYFKSYQAWAYTKGAFDFWAKKLRQRLDEMHGKKRAGEKK